MFALGLFVATTCYSFSFSYKDNFNVNTSGFDGYECNRDVQRFHNRIEAVSLANCESKTKSCMDQS